MSSKVEYIIAEMCFNASKILLKQTINFRDEAENLKVWYKDSVYSHYDKTMKQAEYFRDLGKNIIKGGKAV